ncbi:MAG TPA: DUF2185 domain-containing protein [Verrucomicrobiae bacterium]|nr:DUF2185 domain-containing protein [Verrucomicrobiae bacterium]
MKNKDILQSAAIVCFEVANGAPILRAERSEPQDPADSGWQFLCGISSENWQTAKVWALREVLEREPTLAEFLESPFGTVLIRHSPNMRWKVIKSDK